MRYLIIACIALLTSCQAHRPPEEDEFFKVATIKEPLTRANIVDHSGLSETITSQERLKELAQRNFLEPQPYRKVMRVYARDRQGSMRSIITSYYENGQIHQYLEACNGRASGLYQEWHPNGQKKLQAHVIAGQADIDEKAFPTWAFEGLSQAWNEHGVLIGEFQYAQGALQGVSSTFFDTGEKESKTEYKDGLQDGERIVYFKDGQLNETSHYHKGMREGESVGYHPDGTTAWKETYHDDQLLEATYLLPNGTSISTVVDGKGIRSIFEDGTLTSQQEIISGLPEGNVTIFASDGSIDERYQIKNGNKNGTEIRYFPHSTTPRLSIEWRDGMIHGIVKTWFPSGRSESQREMSQNMKQGLYTAWYSDGSIMLVEEYDNDRLIRGTYHRKGESSPFSHVEKGSGVATLFDDTGSIIEKISYTDGKPQVKE